MASMTSRVAERFADAEPSIWVSVNNAIAIHKPLNLGQGLPDYLPKDHVMKNLQNVALEDNKYHQYTRAFGHLRLVEALAKLHSPFLKHDVDPLNEVIVSVGAYGSLSTIFQTLLNPGDEVVIFEPNFDCYGPMTTSLGAVPKFVAMKISPDTKKVNGVYQASDFKIDRKEIEAAITKKTKFMIINTPSNPTGKVFNIEELQMLADICIKHDIICVSDEVYEFLVYKPLEHIKIASLPGMWERTLTVGSTGKTFSVTGWKLGWTIGPNTLIKGMQAVHQNMVYTCPTPIQEAVARSLEIETPLQGKKECYWTELQVELLEKRDKIVKALVNSGLEPIVPQAGYFIMADISKIQFTPSEEDKHLPRDFQFNNWMMKEKKLSAIPTSAFYCKASESLGEKYVRFCFIKTDETLEKAEKILNSF